MHELRVIPREQQRDVTAVALSYHVNRAQPKLLDNRCGIVCHEFVRKCPRAVGTVTVPALIDADNRAIGGEVVALLCEGVVEEQHAAVQKQNWLPVAEGLGVQLGTSYLVEPLRTGETIRVCGCGCEGEERNQNCASEAVHDASSGPDASEFRRPERREACPAARLPVVTPLASKTFYRFCTTRIRIPLSEFLWKYAAGETRITSRRSFLQTTGVLTVGMAGASRTSAAAA